MHARRDFRSPRIFGGPFKSPVRPNMSKNTQTAAPPEDNVTGQDYADRTHFRYAGPPILDVHAHVMRTRPDDPKTGPPPTNGPNATTTQAETMSDVAREFGIARIWSMCPPEDITPLRDKLGDRIAFNGMINKAKLDEPDDEVFRRLDQFLELGVDMIKFWSAPRGRDRGLFVDAPWRIEAAKRARAAGVTIVMVHVGDPDVWFRNQYADVTKFGTKPDQYTGLERMMEMFPDMTWIGAHMGGDPEHADHLQSLLERFPCYYIDTSATKWQVREVSAHRDAIRSLISQYPDRFLFGSDLVTRDHLTREHYASRYWCQRTLWESAWEGRSPIADPDYKSEPGSPGTPPLIGLGLPHVVLEKVYHANAVRLLAHPMSGSRKGVGAK
jgi:predicted TIM-barrel fold metal-dependent hydrolase